MRTKGSRWVASRSVQCRPWAARAQSKSEGRALPPSKWNSHASHSAHTPNGAARRVGCSIPQHSNIGAEAGTQVRRGTSRIGRSGHRWCDGPASPAERTRNGLDSVALEIRSFPGILHSSHTTDRESHLQGEVVFVVAGLSGWRNSNDF